MEGGGVNFLSNCLKGETDSAVAMACRLRADLVLGFLQLAFLASDASSDTTQC